MTFHRKRTSTNQVTKSVTQSIEHGNYLLLRIHNKSIRGLLDTGSGSSLINSAFAKKLKLPITPIQKGQPPCLFAAEGSKLLIDGVTDIQFNVNGLWIVQSVYCVSNIAETLILGSDFMSQNGVSIDYSKKLVSLCSDLVHAPMICNGDGQHIARLNRITCIEPGCEKIVHIHCSPQYSHKEVLVEALPCSQFAKFAVARSLCKTDQKSNTVARILNCLPHTLVLPKGTKIATVNNINFQKQCEPFVMPSLETEMTTDELQVKLTPQQLDDFAADYGFRVNPELTQTQRVELLTLLYKYRACFARNMRELRRFKNYELELTLKDKKPSFRRQYKLSQEDAQECHRQIQEMEQCKIVEKSQNSNYQSAMFTVRKASGQKRAVLDLRAINEKIEPHLVELPNMNQLLHSLAGQKGEYYTTLDLASSFHQIQLKDGISRDVTSFCDPLTGLRYRYAVAPYGLSSSPSGLITILMGMMSPLVAQGIAFLYMDDICLGAPTWQSHLERLETVLKTLDTNNISCQATKTTLAFPSIKFLGFEISRAGLQITNDKIRIIQALKPPQDKKSLQKFMGLIQFFKDYVPGFSQKTHFMRLNLKKGAKYEWTPQCQAEFDSMIHLLTHAPILQPLSVDKDVYIYTDSSYLGTAFAAFQPCDENPDKLKVVIYGGQALTPSHRSWSVLQIELLGVYHAIRALEPYCRHRVVNIFSDNISLVYLKGMSMGSPREKRIASYLMGFRLTFQHVSGKRQNLVADCLSRSFEEMSVIERESFIPTIDPKDDFLFAISQNNPVSEKGQHTICINDRYNHTGLALTDSSQPANSWVTYSVDIEVPESTMCPRSGANNVPGNINAVELNPSDSAILTHSNLRPEAPPFHPSAEVSQSVRQPVEHSITSYATAGPPPSTAIFTGKVTDENQYKCTTGSGSEPERSETLTGLTTKSAAAAHAPAELRSSRPSEGLDQSQASVCVTTVRRRSARTGTQLGQPVSQQQQQYSVPENNTQIEIPTIRPEDYENDNFLRDIYLYLTKGKLTDTARDRITLLLSDDYFVEEGLLYRISLPRGKAARVQSTEVRLALPQIYLAEVIRAAHDLGHFSQQRTFEFLRSRYYAKNLYDAVAKYQKTCDRCQRMKRDSSKTNDPLHSLPTPNRPNQMWACDHFILSRPTAEGFTAGIIFVDAFSKWPVIRLVKDTSAIHAARVFVNDVVSTFGLSGSTKITLNSDKGSAFCSHFFKSVCELLNIRLITSAAQISTSNGLAEATIKSVKQGIKIFAESDLFLQDAITLIEMSLRFQPHSATKISPFECIFGHPPEWPIFANDTANAKLSFRGDQLDYYNFLAQRLPEIHAGVEQNIRDSKQKNETEYNLRHKATPPTWQIGQEVLISDKKVKPHSNQILTRPRYHGSFLITDIIKNEGFGPSYRLVRTSDGRPLRHLISGSRLKAYTAPQRVEFHKKYPPLPSLSGTAGVSTATFAHDNASQPAAEASNSLAGEANSASCDHQSTNSQDRPYELALRILKERKTDGKREYLVLFANKKKYWADSVSTDLEKAFRIHQDQLRNKRRRRKRKST